MPDGLVFHLAVLFSEQLALLLVPVEGDAFAQPPVVRVVGMSPDTMRCTILVESVASRSVRETRELSMPSASASSLPLA